MGTLIWRSNLSSFSSITFSFRHCYPSSIYSSMSFSSVCDLCGIRTDLFNRAKSYRHIIRQLGTLVPPLWTSLSVIENFSNKAFLDTPRRPTLTLPVWLVVTAASLVTFFASPGTHDGVPFGLGLVPLVLSSVLLFWRRSQVRADVQRSTLLGWNI